MKWRVWQEKVLLLLAIQEQEEDGLASEVLEQQLRMDWPGLGQEVRKICKEVGLPNVTEPKTAVNKEDVKDAIKYHHLKHMKLEMADPKYKKLKIMSHTDLSSRRVYSGWSLEECRMAFRLECFMLDCRVNMPSKYQKDLKCRLASRQVGVLLPAITEPTSQQVMKIRNI